MFDEFDLVDWEMIHRLTQRSENVSDMGYETSDEYCPNERQQAVGVKPLPSLPELYAGKGDMWTRIILQSLR